MTPLFPYPPVAGFQRWISQVLPRFIVSLWATTVFVWSLDFLRPFTDPKAGIMALGALVLSGLMALWGLSYMLHRAGGGTASPWGTLSPPFARRPPRPWVSLFFVLTGYWLIHFFIASHRPNVSPLASPDLIPLLALLICAPGLTGLVFLEGRRTLMSLAVVGCMASLVVLSQRFWPVGWVDPGIWGMPRGLATGTFGNPNYVCLVLAPLIPLFAGVALNSRRCSLLERLGAGTLVILLATVVALTQSRGGALAMVVGLAVLAGWVGSRRAPSRSVLLVLSIIAVVALSALLFATGTAKRLVAGPQSAEVTSLLYRAELWKSTIRLISENPLFGVGPGHLADQLAQHGTEGLRNMPGRGFANERFDTAHQDWLQLGAAWGLPVALCYLGIVALIVVRLIRARKELALGASGGGLLGALAAGGVLTLVDFPLHYPPSALLLWLMLALAVQHCPRQRTPAPARVSGRPSPPGLPAPLSEPGWGPTLALLIVASFLMVPMMISAVSSPFISSLLQQARIHRKTDPQKALRYLVRAREKGADEGLVGQQEVNIFLGLGQPQRARVAALRWTQSRPFDADAHNTLGAIEGTLGNSANAIASLEKGWALSKANIAAAMNLALLYDQLGQKSMALQKLEEVQKLNPEFFEKERAFYERLVQETTTSP